MRGERHAYRGHLHGDARASGDQHVSIPGDPLHHAYLLAGRAQTQFPVLDKSERCNMDTREIRTGRSVCIAPSTERSAPFGRLFAFLLTRTVPKAACPPVIALLSAPRETVCSKQNVCNRRAVKQPSTSSSPPLPPHTAEDASSRGVCMYWGIVRAPEDSANYLVRAQINGREYHMPPVPPTPFPGTSLPLGIY